MLQVERIFENHHAAIRIDNARERFGNVPLAFELPLGANVHARIHPVAAALFAVPIADFAKSGSFLVRRLDLHLYPLLSMLELGIRTVNGTKRRRWELCSCTDGQEGRATTVAEE